MAGTHAAPRRTAIEEFHLWVDDEGRPTRARRGGNRITVKVTGDEALSLEMRTEAIGVTAKLDVAAAIALRAYLGDAIAARGMIRRRWRLLR